MSRSVTVAVLAKAPVPGRVKTRLCPPCSPAQAAQLAAAALEDTLDVDIFSPPRQDWLDKSDGYLRQAPGKK